MALVASTLLAFSLLAASLLFLPEHTASIPAGISYTSHSPITKNGNAQFDNALYPSNGVVSGNGTASNPYIIEGWDVSSSSGTAIRIMNTDAHYVLRNCYVHGNSMWWGIYQYHSLNNTICNNTFSGNSDGIIIDQSSNNTVSGNNFSANGRGIYLIMTCYGILITNNTFTDDTTGIDLQKSYGNVITNNILKDRIGIYLFGSSYNNTISNNNCSSNGEYGIILQATNGNTIRDNNISDNGFSGILLSQGSSYNNISWNKMLNNDNRAVYIQDGSYNRIWNNTIGGNNGGGDQAYDSGTNNWWNTSGSPHGYGNYWSTLTGPDNNLDGIVDWSYNITGTAGAKDWYPLTTTPTVPIPEFGAIPLVIIVLTIVAVLTLEARRRRSDR